jgi:hypothetical protein
MDRKQIEKMIPLLMPLVEKMAEAVVERRLREFYERNLAFRARKYGDTGTDANQMATNSSVSTTVVTVVDQTVANYLPLAGGTLTDGANITVGTATGTKVGTSPAEKLAFYGNGPIAQQANTAGSATAGPAYTATEQAMLNDCYSVLRNIGILS